MTSFIIAFEKTTVIFTPTNYFVHHECSRVKNVVVRIISVCCSYLLTDIKYQLPQHPVMMINC